MTYDYRAQVLEELQTHGIRPKPTTPPALVHEFVSDLYRYELRRLRDRQIRGEIQKARLLNTRRRAEEEVPPDVGPGQVVDGGFASGPSPSTRIAGTTSRLAS